MQIPSEPERLFNELNPVYNDSDVVCVCVCVCKEPGNGMLLWLGGYEIFSVRVSLFVTVSLPVNKGQRRHIFLPPLL